MSVRNHTGYPLVSPDELKPHPGNPNSHSEEQIRILKKIVSHHGWRWGVIVSNRSGYIVAGHARVLAAKRLKTMVPVTHQDFSTEADEVAFMLADNRIQELSTMDMASVNAGLIALDSEMGVMDIEISGYTDAHLVAIANNEQLFDEEGGEKKLIMCPKCGHSFEA